VKSNPVLVHLKGDLRLPVAYESTIDCTAAYVPAMKLCK